MIILLTALIAGFGFSFIYLSWKSTDKETRLSNWLGWLLAFSSMTLLALSDGLEFGIAYGLFGLALIPLGLALMNTDIRPNINSSKNNKSLLGQRQPLNFTGIRDVA